MRHRLPVLLLSAWTAACAGTAAREAPPFAADAGDLETVLFLVGDAGEPDPRFEPVLAALAADVAASPVPALVVFLGDNIYPAGLPPASDPGRAEAERRLLTQLRAVVDAGGEAVFVPGNHDWNFEEGGEIGRILAQERLVEASSPAARFLPDGGCPGPAVEDRGARLRLVYLDTEWWLQDPAAREAAGCAPGTEAAVGAAIGRALAGAESRHVVVLAHHPLLSGGVHGGRFTWQHHLFPLRDAWSWAWVPLPIVGSLYPLIRGSGVSDQDLAAGRNRHMRETLETVFRERPPLLYASGHEHNLQVLEGTSARWLAVSGGGIWGHVTPVGRLEETLWARSRAGYLRVEVHADGRAGLGVIVVRKDGSGRQEFSLELSPATVPADGAAPSARHGAARPQS